MRRPSHTTALTTLLCLAVVGLSGCAAPSKATEADALAERLRAADAVTDVALDYSEPLTLDSGKVDLAVTMTEDASDAAITEVVEITYAAFVDEHDGEEGDLEITLGTDSLHLRSFDARATVDDVASAVTAGLRTRGETPTRIDLTTQDVEEAPYVATDISLTLDVPGRDAVLEALSRAQRAHPELDGAGWRATAGGTPAVSGATDWTLGSIDGFPSSTARRLFSTLGDDVPRGGSISMIDDSVLLSVPKGTPARSLQELTERHLSTLGGHSEAYYDVDLDGLFVMSVTGGECHFDTGTLGTALRATHQDRCTAPAPEE